MYTPVVLIPLSEMGLSFSPTRHMFIVYHDFPEAIRQLSELIIDLPLHRWGNWVSERWCNWRDSLILGLYQWHLYCPASLNTNSRSFYQDHLSDFSSATPISCSLNVKCPHRFPCWNISWESCGTSGRLSLPEGIRSWGGGGRALEDL